MWKLEDEKITASTKWNIISIVYGTPKGGVCELCLTEQFWLLIPYMSLVKSYLELYK